MENLCKEREAELNTTRHKAGGITCQRVMKTKDSICVWLSRNLTSDSVRLSLLITLVTLILFLRLTTVAQTRSSRLPSRP